MDEPRMTREHGPALGRHRHRLRAECAAGAVGASTRSAASGPRIDPRLIYAAAVPGPVALVGAGEFLAPMAEFDRGLLEATGRPRPRVVILPTAAAPDGEQTFRAWAEMGVEHFSALGAEVEPVLVRNAAEGHDAARAPGDRRGRPRLPLGRASAAPARGAAAGRRWARRSARPTTGARSSPAARPGAMAIVGPDGRLPVPAQGPDADAVPGALAGRARRSSTASPCCRTTTPGPSRSRPSSRSRRRRAASILGIDEDTAAVGCNNAWQVHGRGRVTVWRGPPPRAIPPRRGVPDRRPRRRRRLAQLMADCARPPAPLAQARTCRCPRRTGGIIGDQARGPVGPRGSVRADLPEAVGAVDGLVHARLERHLRLVAARRADRGEVLARHRGRRCARSRAGRRSIAHVGAAVARRAPVGAARGAALGVRGEPLLLRSTPGRRPSG